MYSKGSNKKKNGEKTVRLTAWVDPPLPQSGQENVKILDKLSYLGLFCHFIKDKMGQNFHKGKGAKKKTRKKSGLFYQTGV